MGSSPDEPKKGLEAHARGAVAQHGGPRRLRGLEAVGLDLQGTHGLDLFDDLVGARESGEQGAGFEGQCLQRAMDAAGLMEAVQRKGEMQFRLPIG